MTARELETAKAYVRAIKKYDDCCPDVGMGPSLKTLAKPLYSLGYSEGEVSEVVQELEFERKQQNNNDYYTATND